MAAPLDANVLTVESRLWYTFYSVLYKYLTNVENMQNFAGMLPQKSFFYNKRCNFMKYEVCILFTETMLSAA